MKKSRFTEAQIVAILKELDAGTAATKLARRHGLHANTIRVRGSSESNRFGPIRRPRDKCSGFFNARCIHNHIYKTELHIAYKVRARTRARWSSGNRHETLGVLARRRLVYPRLLSRSRHRESVRYVKRHISWAD